MKTSPARWYRDPLPQVDGWPLHRLLCTQEPAMAAVVEPFRDIILAGPPGPAPEAPTTLFNSRRRPPSFDDVLHAYVYAPAEFTRIVDESFEMRLDYGYRVAQYVPVGLVGI